MVFLGATFVSLSQNIGSSAFSSFGKFCPFWHTKRVPTERRPFSFLHLCNDFLRASKREAFFLVFTDFTGASPASKNRLPLCPFETVQKNAELIVTA